jgi:hypothetical protein
VLAQRISDLLTIGPGRWHLRREPCYLRCKFGSSFCHQELAHRLPPPLHGFACLNESGFARFCVKTPVAELSGYRMHPGTRAVRLATPLGAIDPIELWRVGVAAHCTLGGIRRDTEGPQMAGELLSPGSQRRFAYVKPLALLAHGFQHQVHVRVGLVRM